jgi:hypothetical protein
MMQRPHKHRAVLYHQLLQPQVQSANEAQVVDSERHAAQPLYAPHVQALIRVAATRPILIRKFAEVDLVEAQFAKRFGGLAQHMQLQHIQVPHNLVHDVLCAENFIDHIHLMRLQAHDDNNAFLSNTTNNVA